MQSPRAPQKSRIEKYGHLCWGRFVHCEGRSRGRFVQISKILGCTKCPYNNNNYNTNNNYYRGGLYKNSKIIGAVCTKAIRIGAVCTKMLIMKYCTKYGPFSWEFLPLSYL